MYLRDYNHADFIFFYLFPIDAECVTAWNLSDLKQIVRTRINIIDLARVELKTRNRKCELYMERWEEIKWKWVSCALKFEITHTRAALREFAVDLKSDRKSP